MFLDDTLVLLAKLREYAYLVDNKVVIGKIIFHVFESWQPLTCMLFHYMIIEEARSEIIDQTETNMIALRRTIYLTIQSSLDFEECAHKMLKMQFKPGQEVRLKPVLDIIGGPTGRGQWISVSG